jgi:SAM-dependent methyltransferase
MDPEILGHYEQGVELKRLAGGSSRIEFARTRELLERHLPPAPARVLDIGGGPGAYSAWLAGGGYEVTLIDPVPIHVSDAAALAARSARPFTATLGDARDLEQMDASFDVALLFGPLYHLPERAERLRALSEATRVVRFGGVVAVAAISRFASILDGMVNGYLSDPRFNARRTSTVPMSCQLSCRRQGSSSTPCTASRDQGGCVPSSGTTPPAAKRSFAVRARSRASRR